MEIIQEFCIHCNKETEQIVKKYFIQGQPFWENLCRECKNKQSGTKDYSIKHKQ